MEVKPHLPTQDEYIEALKERDINPDAQKYLSKVHAWIAKRRDLSLPAVINPHLNHYYKLYNRGAPDTSKQDLQSPTPSETRIQTRREELIQTWVFKPEIEDSEIESEEDHLYYWYRLWSWLKGYPLFERRQPSRSSECTSEGPRNSRKVKTSHKKRAPNKRETILLIQNI